MDQNEQTSPTAWSTLDTDDVVRRLDSDVVDGLSQDAARERLARYGPNELESEPPPSKLAVMMH